MSLRESVIEIVKDSPMPVAAGLTLWGIELSTWVLVLAIGLGVIRIASAVWDFYWKIKERRNGSK
jgi:hypothetical protein